MRQQASTVRYLTAVCTGSLVLGAAGLLKSKRATTHWDAHDLLERFGATPALFGLINSAAGLALFNLGARLLPPVETALIGALDAPLAPFWVWIMFGETPDAGTVSGGLMVFAAVGGHIWLVARRAVA